MGDETIFDVPGYSRHFTPGQAANRLMSAIYGRPYGIIDTFFRCAYNFNNPIGMAMLYRVAE